MIIPTEKVREYGEGMLAVLNQRFKLGFSYIAVMAPEDQPERKEYWLHVAAISSQAGGQFQTKIALAIDAEALDTDTAEGLVLSIGMALIALGVDTKEDS